MIGGIIKMEMIQDTPDILHNLEEVSSVQITINVPFTVIENEEQKSQKKEIDTLRLNERVELKML